MPSFFSSSITADGFYDAIEKNDIGKVRKYIAQYQKHPEQLMYMSRVYSLGLIAHYDRGYILQLLNESNLFVNVPVRVSENPLSIAARHDHYEIFVKLLQLKLPISDSVWHAVADKPQFIHAMLDKMSDSGLCEYFQFSARCAYLKGLEACYELRSDLVSPKAQINMALFNAHSDPECLQFLLDRGADVNYISVGKDGYAGTTLTRASGAYLESVKVLLAARANPNAFNALFETPIIRAAAANEHKIVAELITHGANVDAQDTNGMTALMYAAKNNSSLVTQLLLAACADISVRDNANKTANDYANAEIIDLLLNDSFDKKLKLFQTMRAISAEAKHPNLQNLMKESLEQIKDFFQFAADNIDKIKCYTSIGDALFELNLLLIALGPENYELARTFIQAACKLEHAVAQRINEKFLKEQQQPNRQNKP